MWYCAPLAHSGSLATHRSPELPVLPPSPGASAPPQQEGGGGRISKPPPVKAAPRRHFPFAAEFGGEPPPSAELGGTISGSVFLNKSKNIRFTHPSVVRSWAPRAELKGKVMKTRRLCENINDSYFQKLIPTPALVDSTGSIRGSPAKQLSCLQSVSGAGKQVSLC